MNSIVQLASGSLRSEPLAHFRLLGCPAMDRAPLRLTPSLQCAAVYTHRNLDVIATGPVSHVNNALTMAQGDTGRLADPGVYLLQPGESFGAHMRIESGPTP